MASTGKSKGAAIHRVWLPHPLSQGPVPPRLVPSPHPGRVTRLMWKESTVFGAPTWRVSPRRSAGGRDQVEERWDGDGMSMGRRRFPDRWKACLCLREKGRYDRWKAVNLRHAVGYGRVV